MRILATLAILFVLSAPIFVFAADTSELGFVPLTSIPGIEDAGNASSLPAFLNNIYKLAIGAAAILAVLQIVRAGIMYMGGDSVTEKKDAKSLIGLSIGGLVLVLSPVIVFSIINPKILDLEIGGLSQLGTKSEELLWTDTTLSSKAASERCSSEGGTFEYVCRSAGDTNRTISAGQSCKAGESGTAFCKRVVTAGAPTNTAALCANFEQPSAVSSSGSCRALVDPGTVKVDNACCPGISEGNQCCAYPKEAATTPTAPNIEASIVALKYAYSPVTGTPEDLGPVPSYKSAYDGYVAACRTAGKTEKNTYGTKVDCSASVLAATSDARKAYIKCVNTTVSCVAK